MFDEIPDDVLCTFMEEWEKSQPVGKDVVKNQPSFGPDDESTNELCAVDRETNELVKPAAASKTRHYTCLVCSEPLHVKAGMVRRKHFSHYANSSCTLFHGGESDLHQYAKLLLKRFLDAGGTIHISAADSCHGMNPRFGRCGSIISKPLGAFSKNEGECVSLEFPAPDRSWSADVAVHYKGSPRFILEVKATHATSTPRPEPWFEFNASDICEISGSDCDLYDVREDRKIFCNNCALVGSPWLLRIPRIPFKRNADGTSSSLPGPWPCILCGRNNYSHVWEKGKRQCCVICLGNQTADVRRVLDEKGL